MADRLKMDPSKDRINMKSKISSIVFSKAPWHVRYLILQKMMKRMFSRVLYKLPSMSETAKLQMKIYMGECRFLFLPTAMRTSRFSSTPRAAMVKKISSGTMTCAQSEVFIESSLLFSDGGAFACPRSLVVSEPRSIFIVATFGEGRCMRLNPDIFQYSLWLDLLQQPMYPAEHLLMVISFEVNLEKWLTNKEWETPKWNRQKT